MAATPWSWTAPFTIDTRSLAVFRILIAAVVLGDLALRAPDIAFFLSDQGALPVADLPRFNPIYWSWSLHALSGSSGWQWALFTLHALAALGLALGWRTRWTALLTWALLISLHSRNPQILQGGDVLLRCLLFWGLFLPLGARWSLDSRRTPGPDVVTSAASAAVLLQLAMMYLFSGILKWHPVWHSEGTAVWYALHLDQLTTPLGRWLGEQEAWLPWITRGTLAFELLGWLFAFSPWRTAWFRGATLVAFLAFHVGLALCLHLGPFPFVCLAGWLLFTPSEWWDWLATRRTHPAPASPGTLTSAPRLPYWQEALVLMLLANVVLWNLRTTAFDFWRGFYPPSVNWIVEVPRLDQMWAMFAPYPQVNDGWYEVPAKLQDERRIDLLTWQEPTADPPSGHPYAGERWRKYLMNLYLAENTRWRPLALRALVRRFESAHPGSTVAHAELRFWVKTNRWQALPLYHEELLQSIP
jgi:hypothetical protein